jgi:hypothetical protein
MMKKINQLITQAIAPACEKHGMLQHKIVTDWESIVGHHIASVCMPIQTKFSAHNQNNGTLVIGVKNPGYVLEIQAMQNTIIERVTTYFGYNAISKIRLIYVQ